jgi:tetratricopeptide (TPR) repeat protein
MLVGIAIYFALEGFALGQCPPRPRDASQARKEAKRWWKKASLFFKQLNFVAAKEAYLCSYKMVPHPNTLHNIALSAVGAGKAAEALRYYQRYLKARPNAPDNVSVTARIRLLQKILKQKQTAQSALLQEASRCRRQLAETTKAARASCTQRVATMAKQELSRSRRMAQARCRKRIQRIRAKQKSRCGARVARVKAQTARRLVSSSRTGGWQHLPALDKKLRYTWRSGLFFVVVGSVLTAGGVIAGLVALRDRSKVSGLNDGDPWTNEYQDTYDRYKQSFNAFWGLASAGAASLLLGSIMMAIGNRRGIERATPGLRAGIPNQGISLGASPVRGGGIVVVTGDF